MSSHHDVLMSDSNVTYTIASNELDIGKVKLVQGPISPRVPPCLQGRHPVWSSLFAVTSKAHWPCIYYTWDGVPGTILKSYWSCHVLVILAGNHVMCFLTSVFYFPWLVFRLHCITVHFIAFRLRSTLAFRLHCKTISGEVMLCCLLSSLGLQVFSTWILNCICVKFFRVFFQFVFEIKL